MVDAYDINRKMQETISDGKKKKSKRSYVFRCKFKKKRLKRVLGLELGPYFCEVNQINQNAVPLDQKLTFFV